MGPLLTDSIQRYDTSVVQTLVMLYATLSILGVFLGDVLMMIIDPRITLSNKGRYKIVEDQNKVLDQKLENEDELFKFVEYSPEKAEMIGYSDYSYWKSVFQNFMKKKSAVTLSIIFIALVIFSFIALAIGKYDYAQLVTDSSKAFISPNAEYWFGTDNIGRDYWCRYGTLPRLPSNLR